jgi:hypothetical protein
MHETADHALSRIAVSIKQPWATLVVHGLKKIELRRWRPRRLGLVYIHAGGVPDASNEAWEKLPKELESFAKLRKGLLGRVQVTGAKRYETLDEFHRDSGGHLAPDAWFRDGGVFGWILEAPEVVPLEPCRGNLRFFRV